MLALQAAGAYPEKFDYPITLQFELTGQCNLKCKHCYNRSGDADRETLMTPEKWCELSRQIVSDGGIFQCIISGGEPLLLGEKLFDIMDILHDDGTSFVVISNGLLLTKKFARRFNKYVISGSKFLLTARRLNCTTNFAASRGVLNGQSTARWKLAIWEFRLSLRTPSRRKIWSASKI